jgi:indolepyruvate ferredoxin oxidoreductase alpha subunit
MTGLLDAINDNSSITVFIMDNSTTGMTGGQTSSALGKVEQICEGLGVDKDHIKVLKPLPKNHEENKSVVAEELAYKGLSVIIPRRECIQTLNKRMRAKFSAKKITV